MNPKPSIWEEILEDARFAPSPHNVQPWRVRILSEQEATLLYDPKRLIPDEDIEGSFTLAGFAILLEYMSIVAQGKGFHLAYAYNGNRLDRTSTELIPLFQLSLTPADSHAEFSSDLIRRRLTSRLPFSDKCVSEDVLSELRSIAASFGYTYTFSQCPPLVRWVVKLNCDTLFCDMDDDLTRNEVASELELYPAGQGVFQNRDIRLKQKYIIEN